MAKKARAPRVHLTHIEVRRGAALRLRLAIADDAFAEVGDELGALLKKLAPGTSIRTLTPETGVPIEAEECVVTPEHDEDDLEYHAGLRARLTNLFSSLCDELLSAASEIARDERARRVARAN